MVRFCLQRACVSGIARFFCRSDFLSEGPSWSLPSAWGEPCLPPFICGWTLRLRPGLASRTQGGNERSGGLYVFKFVFVFSVVEYRALELLHRGGVVSSLIF